MNDVVETTMDLSMFSAIFVDTLNEWLPEKDGLTNEDVISVGPGRRLLKVVRGDFTSEVPIKGDASKYLSGYITLASITRRALPTLSWQFVEWVLETYGVAFNEGELKYGEMLSEEFIMENYTAAGAIGIRREFLTRWVENGVMCKTDIAVRDEIRLMPKDEKGNAKINFNYPILIIGQVMFFNQHFPCPAMVIRHESGDLGPKVVNAVLFESLGLVDIVQKGPYAEFVYDGVDFVADGLGTRIKSFT